VLPTVSEKRWEEECAAPNSCSITVSGGSGLAASAGRSTISPPFLCRLAWRLDFRAGPFPIRCVHYNPIRDFVQCNMGMDDMRPLHAPNQEANRLSIAKFAMDLSVYR
jgi:hypothetical protein